MTDRAQEVLLSLFELSFGAHPLPDNGVTQDHNQEKKQAFKQEHSAVPALFVGECREGFGAHCEERRFAGEVRVFFLAQPEKHDPSAGCCCDVRLLDELAFALPTLSGAMEGVVLLVGEEDVPPEKLGSNEQKDADESDSRAANQRVVHDELSR